SPCGQSLLASLGRAGGCCAPGKGRVEMQPVAINLWALLAAVVASFVVGGIWYSPLLFMRPWLAMAGVDKARFDAGLPKALVGDLIGSLLLAFVLVHAIV